MKEETKKKAKKLLQSAFYIDSSRGDAIMSLMRDMDNLLNSLQPQTVESEECKCKEPKPNYPEMVWCDECKKEIGIKECNCTNPTIYTDKNGINYCEKCKCETEILSQPLTVDKDNKALDAKLNSEIDHIFSTTANHSDIKRKSK